MHEVIIKASEGHRAFGKLLKRVFRSDEHLIVERDGYPVAVLLSFQEYTKLKGDRAIAAFDSLSRAIGRDIEEQGITEEELLADVEAARQEAYSERYGKLG
jgi:PHD/YefM family antitoxin component YafN of YafNO toxin-antitoxin module